MERISVKGLEGVSVSVSHNGQVLAIGDYGRLGILSHGKIRLDVWVQARYEDTHVFTVDGGKNIAPKRNQALEWREERHYNLNIPIENASHGIPFARYPQNNLRVLVIEKNGWIQVWEIALISQFGNFFLTVQQTYRVRCYRDGEKVVCPQLKWPQMDSFVENLKEGDPKELTPLAEYQPEPKPTGNGLGPKEALVLWYNMAKQVGYIVDKDGKQIRVHWTQIERPGPIVFLLKGEVVTYADLKPTRGATSFEKEAFGIKPLLP